MKECGFTLAEVLVTLGIIGVVAALTTPALIQNVGNAKVGPKLAKAKATFETAAEMMLTENSSNTIMSITDDGEELGKQLSRYMKISRNATDINYKSYKSTETRSNADNPMALGEPGWKRFDSDDGMIYWVRFKFFKSAVDTANYVDIPNNQNISSIWVDINGAEGPNMIARDVFKFALYNDGTLRPWGAHGFMRLKENIPDDAILWDDNHACTSEKVTYANSCAGSIFDNGMKIIYQ